MFRAQLVSLNKARGRLRVCYNWLYSALNCTTDTTGFYWTVSKLNDSQVSLSPSDGYGGMTLYASARDDNNWFMQVQAPYSADWITAVGGDETLGLDSSRGFLIVGFKGFNGQYVTVNDQVSDHDGTSGYRLQSLGGSDQTSYLWLLADAQPLQPQVQLIRAEDASSDDIAAALAQFGTPAVSVADVQSLIGGKSS
jgi:hypothetical protein